MKKFLSLSLMFTLFAVGIHSVLANSNTSEKEGAKIPQGYKNAERLIYKERYEEAIEELDKVLSKDKKNADAWNLFGYASRKTGNLVSADKAYARALDLNPEHLGALEYQGELFIMQGRIDMAKGNLAVLETLCPDSCAEREDLSEALANAGH